MPYRIVFTGAFETGKTTLLERFSGYPFILTIPEVARDLLRKNPFLERDPDFQNMIFVEQIYRETMGQLSGKPVVICDRGMIDLIAYSKVYGYPIRKEWRESLDNRYDVAAIFDKDDIPDPIRHYATNLPVKEFQNQIDLAIRETVSTFKLRSIEIRGNLLERENTIKSHLQHLGLWLGEQN